MARIGLIRDEGEGERGEGEMEKRQETGVGDPTRAGLLRHHSFFFFSLFSYDFYLLAISNISIFNSNSIIIFSLLPLDKVTLSRNGSLLAFQLAWQSSE